jgi:hypothetical protein
MVIGTYFLRQPYHAKKRLNQGHPPPEACPDDHGYVTILMNCLVYITPEW